MTARRSARGAHAPPARRPRGARSGRPRCPTRRGGGWRGRWSATSLSRHDADMRILAVFLLVVLALAAAAPAADRSRTYAIPGDKVFPEGVAYDAASKAFYVGSTTDGQIFRGRIDGPAAVGFLPGGRDGRTTATGMKVAGRRLY